MASVFDRVRLNPRQLRTVADRRCDDANYLRKSKQNDRANGAIYLGGFVLECLLKAALLERHKWLQNASGSQENWSSTKRRLYHLCYKSHDLVEILEHLSVVVERLIKVDPSRRLYSNMQRLCGEWTIHARYSPHAAKMTEAAQFLDKVKEIMRWL